MSFSAPISGFNISTSLSPSARINTAKALSPNASSPSLWEASKNLNLPISQLYGPQAPDLGALVGLDSSQFLGRLGGSSRGWTFITSPEDISWDIANQANRVDIFGTNNPPVVAGSRGMRDLTLGNSLVEGFVRGKQIEGKIKALEDLMQYGENLSDGFVSVPVYQVWANDKSYGGSEAYYIIRDIRIKEAMRDLNGNATRAYVDISLMQVPAYQVNSGRDQASATTAGAKSGLLETVKNQANQNVAKPGTAAGNKPGANAASGAGSSSQAAKPVRSTPVQPLDLNKPVNIITPQR